MGWPHLFHDLQVWITLEQDRFQGLAPAGIDRPGQGADTALLLETVAGLQEDNGVSDGVRFCLGR